MFFIDSHDTNFGAFQIYNFYSMNNEIDIKYFQQHSKHLFQDEGSIVCKDLI